MSSLPPPPAHLPQWPQSPTEGSPQGTAPKLDLIIHSVSASILQTMVWKDAAAAFVRAYNDRISVRLAEPPYELPYGPPPHEYNTGWGPSGDQLPGLGPGWFAVRPENPQDWGLVPDIWRGYDPLPNYLPLRTSNLENDDPYGSGWLSMEVDLGPWHDPAWDKLALDINPPPSLPPLIHDLSFARIMMMDEWLAAWETYIDFCQIVGVCALRRDMLNLPAMTCNRLRPRVWCRLSGGAATRDSGTVQAGCSVRPRLCHAEAVRRVVTEGRGHYVLTLFRKPGAPLDPIPVLAQWAEDAASRQLNVESYSKLNLSVNDLNDKQQLHKEHAVLEEELEQTVKLKEDVNNEQALVPETRGTNETDKSG